MGNVPSVPGLFTKSNASGTTQYSWDFENRLTQAVVPGVGTVTFRYDPFGRRTQKSGPNGTVNYVYDAATAIEEVDASGNLLAHYAQGAGIDELLSELRSGASVFYEQDALGSITSLSSLNSTVLGSYTYDTFGNTTALTGSFVNPYRYTGRDYDAEIGLQYSRARYFDSADGRFLSEDPARFSAGANFYSYVGNSPVSFYDPFGLAKYVLIVGQPGLGEHNIGRTFDIAAQTEAADLRAQGNDVTVVNAATVQGFNSALNSNGTIDGGVEYFGHSTYNALFIGQDTGPNTNLTFGNVSLLSNSHLGPDAVIALQGCFAGSGADESIAQAIANQLKRRVTAYPNSTFFAAGKCPKYTRPSDRAPNKPPARVCQQGGAPPLNFYPKK